MYWKINKITPDQLFRQYGAHLLLIFAGLIIVILIATRPSTPKVSGEMKLGFEEFAKAVTMHLLDTSYISYTDSTFALMNGELAPSVLNKLRQQETLAKNEDEIRATAKTLSDSRQVSAVKIERIVTSELDPRGLVPVEVSGVVAIHSADESGPTGPVPFDFKYLIGVRIAPDGKPMMGPDAKTPVPMVTDFQDVSSTHPAPGATATTTAGTTPP